MAWTEERRDRYLTTMAKVRREKKRLGLKQSDNLPGHGKPASGLTTPGKKRGRKPRDFAAPGDIELIPLGIVAKPPTGDELLLALANLPLSEMLALKKDAQKASRLRALLDRFAWVLS